MSNHNEEGRSGGAGEIHWWFDIPLAVAVMYFALHHSPAEKTPKFEPPPTPTPIVDTHIPTPLATEGVPLLLGGSTSFE